MGVRRLRTLGVYSRTIGTPPDPDTIAELVANGYDASILATAEALGVTDETLLALPYGLGVSGDEISQAEQQLLAQLGGAAPPVGAPATAAPSYPAGAVPQYMVNTAFGTLDLLQESTWNQIAALFQQAQQQLQAVAKASPNDNDVISQVNTFNSLVAQFSDAWNKVFGSAPSSMPMVSLSGLGILPLIAVTAVAAAVVAVCYGLYLLFQWLTNRSQTAAQTQQQQQGMAALQSTGAQQLAAAKAALASGNTALYNQLMAAYNQTQATLQKTASTTPTTATAQNWSLWFQQNWGYIAAAFAAIVILPPLMKKI
jgi:hypothetical protein